MRLPNSFGNVSKLPGNRRKPYRARITIGWKTDESGKRKQIFKTVGYYETREEGLIALAEYHKNPYDLNASKITFAEVFEKWSAEHYPKVGASSIQGYNTAYKLCGVIYNMRFADLRLSHLQNVVDNAGKNYPTLRKVKILFNVMYKYALQNDICNKDYSQFVDIVQYRDRNPNKYERIPFSREEITTIWKRKDTNEYISVILILIYSGVRIGELLDLKKENVNLSERCFDITASKTDAGIRKVPIAERIQPYFEHWLNKNDSEYLISTPEGNHLAYSNYSRYYWKPIMEEMNMSHRPHGTRHTCVSLLTAAGVDGRLIKKIVGHSGKGVTEAVYTHFEIQELIDAIDKI